MKKALVVTALIASTLATPAFAIGDKEANILLGGVIGYIIGKNNQPQPIYGPAPQPMPQPYPQSGPVYQGMPMPVSNCNTVLTIQQDAFGREYRTPVTICR
jgi:hypothetical protein